MDQEGAGALPVIVEEDQFFTDFPGLATDPQFKTTSNATPAYNCIAFAADVHERNWWPNTGSKMDPPYWWPAGCRNDETVEAFVEAFGVLMYRTCDSPDYEQGYEKVAIFVDDKGVPTHTAFQSSAWPGEWRSKIGWNVDVRHSLNSVCDFYGTVHTIMKRKSLRKRTRTRLKKIPMRQSGP